MGNKQPVAEKKQPPKEKPIAIFVAGGPGSGKGTQCKIMKDKYNFGHLSTGSLLREFAEQGGEIGKQIADMMKQGVLVPSNIIVKALKEKIMSKYPQQKVFILDGFPRNEENYKQWENIMKDDIDVRMLLYINCNLDILKNRLLQRAKKQNRADDNPQTIQKRFRIFTSTTLPFCQLYKKSHPKFYQVDGMKSIQEVSESINQVLKKQGLI